MTMRSRAALAAALALTAVAGVARADGSRSWTVCGGSTFNTCASVDLTVVGQSVTMHVWNLSGFFGSYANTVFTGVGFEGIGNNVAVAGCNNNDSKCYVTSTMTGPVRAGNTPQAWKLHNDMQIGGGVKLDVVTTSDANAAVDNSIASGCANNALLPGGSSQLWENPCAMPAGPNDAGWITISFNVTGTWDVDDTWLLVKGQNGPNGQSTECMTGGTAVNCTPTTTVPEPLTMTLLASGLAGVGGVGALRRRRWRSDEESAQR